MPMPYAPVELCDDNGVLLMHVEYDAGHKKVCEVFYTRPGAVNPTAPVQPVGTVRSCAASGAVTVEMDYEADWQLVCVEFPAGTFVQALRHVEDVDGSPTSETFIAGSAGVVVPVSWTAGSCPLPPVAPVNPLPMESVRCVMRDSGTGPAKEQVREQFVLSAGGIPGHLGWSDMDGVVIPAIQIVSVLADADCNCCPEIIVIPVVAWGSELRAGTAPLSAPAGATSVTLTVVAGFVTAAGSEQTAKFPTGSWSWSTPTGTLAPGVTFTGNPSAEFIVSWTV